MLNYFQKRSEDVWGGLVCLAVGLFIIVESAGYSLGHLRSMGPGYFPALQGVLISAVGLSLLIWARPNEAGQGSPMGTLRGVFLLAGAFIAFALLIERWGLVPSVLVTTFLASRCDRRIPVRNGLILAVATAAGCFVIFNVILGVQVEAFK